MAIDFLIARFIIWIVEPIPPFSMFSTVCVIHFSMYWNFCKDCYNGMSLGKRIMGIQIIDIKTLSIENYSKSVEMHSP